MPSVSPAELQHNVINIVYRFHDKCTCILKILNHNEYKDDKDDDYCNDGEASDNYDDNGDKKKKRELIISRTSVPVT